MKEGNTIKCIVYFDNNCSLCTSIIKTLQVFKVENVLYKPIEKIKTGNTANEIIVISDKKQYKASAAILELMKYLGWFTKLLSTALRIIPIKILDKVYYWVARNRYKWFGKNQCSIN